MKLVTFENIATMTTKAKFKKINSNSLYLLNITCGKITLKIREQNKTQLENGVIRILTVIIHIFLNLKISNE